MVGTNYFSSSAQKDKQIKICIRGMAGLLGSRLAYAIGKNPDMRLIAGVVKKDPTLANLFTTMRTLPEQIRRSTLPTRIYLDEKHATVREVNSSQNIINFEPADQLDLSDFDIVVDASTPGTLSNWIERYKHFKGPVLLQSGEFPNGKLVTAPLVGKIDSDNLYRQGDCILCGIIPVLAYLAPNRLTMHVLTQYTEKLGDYPTDIRLRSSYMREDVAKQLSYELSNLFDYELVVMGVTQIPGISYYTITLLVETKPLTGLEVKEMLLNRPRIRVVPDLKSTFEIEQLHKERVHFVDMEIPPITVFGSDLNSTETKTNFKLVITMDYKPLVSLANVDSIRALALEVDPESAMRTTDKNMSFINSYSF